VSDDMKELEDLHEKAANTLAADTVLAVFVGAEQIQRTLIDEDLKGPPQDAWETAMSIDVDDQSLALGLAIRAGEILGDFFGKNPKAYPIQGIDVRNNDRDKTCLIIRTSWSEFIELVEKHQGRFRPWELN